eukprot:CAMPEP_0194370294 /NCGR_PEP_ID=MMETSP0174-20130528/18570_1 /TAXON_ID=216777 /ORGANISM="Proboscia alata, Strain PI-D3" /LENGTH=61 /DNA_ID=CAMNT_0039147649 /DNA_START=1017 /DNA_END=1202 /DNA_ORIENTATION=-
MTSSLLEKCGSISPGGIIALVGLGFITAIISPCASFSPGSASSLPYGGTKTDHARHKNELD